MEAILAIETCVPEASVVLWRDGVRVFEQGFASDRNHNSMVFDALEKAIDILDGQKLDLVIVGTGPGSYSGTRIGIAAGQGVALAHGCPVAGLGSFAATPIARENAAAMAVGDARRGLYFTSRISETGVAMVPELMERADFDKVLDDAQDVALFTFDDPAGLESEGVSIIRTRPEARYLVDVWLGLGAACRAELIDSPLSPTYLRAPFTSKATPGHPLLR